MKAIVYRQYGSPDVLELQDVEEPVMFGSLDLGLSAEFNLDVGLVLLIVAAVIIVGWAILWLVKSLRERVLSVFREMWGGLSILIKEPRRAIALFGSNFATNLVLGITMWLMVPGRPRLVRPGRGLLQWLTRWKD